MLPINSILGHLDIFEVYEYLDGPRLFAAKNNIGTLFLVFWFDEEDDATGWLYLPISETRLNRLRRKTLSLNAAFRNPETNYYIVYLGIPPRTTSVQVVNSTNIDPDYFPPDGYYIEHVHVLNEPKDGWDFETILIGTRPSAKILSQFIGLFRELIEGIMQSQTGKTHSLYTPSALPGSIKIKFNSNSKSDAIESLKILEQLLSSENENEFRQRLAMYKVSSSSLREFLSSIFRNKLDVEIVPKLAADGEAITLTMDKVQKCIEYLDNLDYISVDSIKIPQANDISKVIEILYLIRDGGPLVPGSIVGLTTKRQIQYYLRAAYAYGLATIDEQLTPAGYFVISHSDKESQYQILADRFESTEFGWAWMKWANVEYMTDLDPETATDFLIASVPSLNEVTAKRRSGTLKKWLTELKPFHRKYQSS